MAFDPSTAKKTGFDPSSAKPEKDSYNELPSVPTGKEPDYVPESGMFDDVSLLGAIDSIGTLATGATTGALGFASGALSQLASEIISGEYGTPEAAERVKQSAMGYGSRWTAKPFTEEGEKTLGAIGEVAGNLPMAPASGLSPMIRQSTGVAGTMAASKISQAAQKAAMIKPILQQKFGRNIQLIDRDNLPVPALQKALKKHGTDYSIILDDPERMPVFSGGKSPDDIVQGIMVKKIKSGSDNATLYNKRLEGGKVVNDALGDEAIKQGYRPGQVSSAAHSNRDTRDVMTKMLETKRVIEASEDRAVDIRPGYYIGNVVMDRVGVVKKKSLDLRNKLNGIADNFKKDNTQIDSSGVQDAFFRSLEDSDIKIPDEAYRNPTLLNNLMKSREFFDGSDIAKDKASQKVIRDVVDLLSKGEPTAYRAHKLKRQIDTMIDYNQKTYGGLTDTGKNFAKTIRKSLNDSVREVSPDYARTNDELTKIFTALEDVRAKLPKKIDFDDPRSYEAMGQEMRKLLTNYKARNEIHNAIRQVDELSSLYGGDNKVDVNRLVVFNNTLDDRFMPSAKGSFKGEIRSATDRSIDVTQMASKTAALNKAANTVVESLEKFKNINDQEAYNVMQRILNRKDK